MTMVKITEGRIQEEDLEAGIAACVFRTTMAGIEMAEEAAE